MILVQIGLWWTVPSQVDGARLLLGAFAEQFAQSEYWCFVTFTWFLVNDQRDAQFFSMYLSLFLTLYMFRAHRAHHQERQIMSIQTLVAVTLCRWPCRVQVGSFTSDLHTTRLPTATRGCIDTIYLSWLWARCARNMYRVKNKDKYIEKKLCVTLAIYQEP